MDYIGSSADQGVYHKEKEKNKSMSNLFDHYNKSVSTIREGIDLQSMQFVKLAAFEGKTVKVDGFFFTNGDYGKQVVVVGNGYKINMPARAVEQFESIQKHEEELQAVMDGKLMITDIRALKKTTGYRLTD